ncbi:MAG: HPF/RaiA family ribosome-associated protein [Hymenobacteraceae bacterium]|nr:HPF/RaiA family ribosome-associated protein [Hymenobacteraceae bacterium]
MLIQLNTDNTLTASAGLSQHVQEALSASLMRFSADITRVEVHLGDENSSTKTGTDDKRCVLEARLAGHPPLVVTHHAATINQALDGGIDRLKHLLANTLDRRKDHR